MKLEEAIQFFDRVLPLDAAWLVIDGERIGVPYCCDSPVVENSQGDRIACLDCGREIRLVARQWVVSNWGRKGINLLRLNAPLQVEAARAMAQSTIPENLDIAPESSSGGGADSGHCDDAEALRAEVERLRRALERVAYLPKCYEPLDTTDAIREYCRAVLEAKS